MTPAARVPLPGSSLRPLPPPAAPRLLGAGVLYLLLVVYGSLVPLEYVSMPVAEAWRHFQNIRFLQLGPESRADWVANLLLYIPLAFLLYGGLEVESRLRLRATLPLVYLICGATALGVEFAQMFFPQRTVSMNDLVAEFIGTNLGVALWASGGQRLLALWQEARRGGPGVVRSVLILYLLAYLVLSLFPYDFLVSTPELRAKLYSGLVGALLAPQGCDFGLRCALKLVFEVLVMAPVGLLLGWLWGRRALGRILGLGLIMGVLIECLQLVQVSGVAQGVSVVTRVLGLGMGALLLWRWQAAPPRLALAPLRVGLALLALPYLGLLAALNGWFDRPWLEADSAWARLSHVHFVPFYYHYFMTETGALLSLLRVTAGYAPVGLGLWLWAGLPRLADPLPAVSLAALLAMGMEISKLFLDGKHPDPTNILIAATAAGLAVVAAAWVRRWQPRPETRPAGAMPRGPAARPTPPPAMAMGYATPARHPLPPGAGPAAGAHALHGRAGPPPRVAPAPARAFPRAGGARVPVLQRLLALGLLAAVVWGVLAHPLFPAGLALGCAAYGALLWRWPWAWLVAVPALLPVLDLAPWTGRFFVTEFDLLILTTGAVALWRRPLAVGRPLLIHGAGVLVGLVALAEFTGIVLGVFPLPDYTVNAVSNYYSSLNALRLAKGLAGALLLLALLRAEAARGTRVGYWFCVGMVAGLSAAVLVVAWERVLFSGLWNFNLDYRVTGLFSGMHTGGAFIDGYLSAALPFVAACFLLWRGRWAPLAWVYGFGLLAGVVYALLVTFSRADFLAVGMIALVLGVGGSYFALRRGRLGTLLLAAVPVVVVAVAVALPVLGGSFIQYRFSMVPGDLNTRLEHWRTALDIRNDDPAVWLLGMGRGTFPRTWYEANPTGRRPATYQYLGEAGDRFVRLTSGDSLYLGQRIRPGTTDPHRLSLVMRSTQDDPVLTVPICEKSILYAFKCQWAVARAQGPAGQWLRFEAAVELAHLGLGPWYTRRPVELALYNGGHRPVVDVTQVSLTDREGRELLVNGGFEAGPDHWFFATDNHLPWHIKNIWVQVLFEQGWLGLLVFTLLLMFVAYALWLRLRAQDPLALLLAAALAGFLAVGLFDSLFDEPRTSLLFYLLCWMALLWGRPAPRDPVRTGGTGPLPLQL